jgi:hypothetical protein
VSGRRKWVLLGSVERRRIQDHNNAYCTYADKGNELIRFRGGGDCSLLLIRFASASLRASRSLKRCWWWLPDLCPCPLLLAAHGILRSARGSASALLPEPTAAAGGGDLVMSSVSEQDMTAEAGLALIVSLADPSLGSQHLDVRFACEAIEDQSATQLNTLAAPFRSVACRPGSINGE